MNALSDRADFERDIYDQSTVHINHQPTVAVVLEPAFLHIDFVVTDGQQQEGIVAMGVSLGRLYDTGFAREGSDGRGGDDRPRCIFHRPGNASCNPSPGLLPRQCQQ